LRFSKDLGNERGDAPLNAEHVVPAITQQKRGSRSLLPLSRLEMLAPVMTQRVLNADFQLRNLPPDPDRLQWPE
jgi:hypothetical protein